MKAKRKLKRLFSLLLALLLVVGMLPATAYASNEGELEGTTGQMEDATVSDSDLTETAEELTVEEVNAANATTLYIADTVGEDAQAVTKDTQDGEGGWSYEANTATLTLDGFNGAYIEANGDLNIVLKGTNTITMASASANAIKTTGKLTIDDTTSPADDSLTIICNDPAASAYMIYTGGYGEEYATHINGGTVKLKGTTTKKSIYGVYYWLYVNNDANFVIDLSAGETYTKLIGTFNAFYHRTSGKVTGSVNTQSNTSFLIYKLYQQGTGDIDLTAGGMAQVISQTFEQSSGATGTVTVKGYLSSFYPAKKTCTIEGYDNVIWSYYTSNPLGSGKTYFLCDSTGTPIKDPVIKYVENQPLTVMDSVFFDIPEKKVGESFEKTPYWNQGCKGGTGSYEFYLAEDSAPLPAGVTVNTRGYFNGTPTEAHTAGVAKIKVVSGTETAYFNINYGEVKDRDYFLTIDGAVLNMASNSAGMGYFYAAENSTLTLSGYNGGPVISEKSLNIVLDGANTITMATDSAYGIKVDGKLTIDDTTSPADDSLTITCNEPNASANMVSAALSHEGGTVRLKGATTKNSIIGFDSSVRVKNDANLFIDLSAGENNVNIMGVDGELYQTTSGVASVSVTTRDSSSYLIGNLYQYGTGDITLTAGENANVIKKVFEQFEGATGTITVKGYIWGFYPQKGTCTVEGYDNVIWSYYTGTGGSNYLCDSTGKPIKDPVIKYVKNQPLTVMDSVLFDIPEKKVGESFEKLPYWNQGCKGGTGSYKFYLADDSDPLPEGVTVNISGYFDGAPTEAHAAGVAKIKVVSGEETAYFNINYGEVTYNNPVTSIELDKTEVILNKGEAVDLTATIMPENADKRNVNWSLSKNLGKLEELSFNENSNKRKARFTAGNIAGVLDITAASLIGGFNKNCKIYIKEAKPTASAGNKYIEGLGVRSTYTINGIAYTADSSGRIEIDDSWRETIISLVKTNEEPKCNSDEQKLTVGKYIAVDINTLSELISLEYSNTTYDGNKKEPQVSITGLTQDTDYTVTYENDVNAGKATVIITGIGDYCGTLYKYFTIDKASIEKFEFTLSDIEYIYNKTEKKPEVLVSGLVKDKDYTVEYKDNIAVGTASVTITGKGNYTGVVVKTFIIKENFLCKIDEISDLIYTGQAQKPVVKIYQEGVLLKSGKDYTLTYVNNKNANAIGADGSRMMKVGDGVYDSMSDEGFNPELPYVIIKGKGNYQKEVYVNFNILPPVIGDGSAKEAEGVVLKFTDHTEANGKLFKPLTSIKCGKITMKAGVDYEVKVEEAGVPGTNLLNAKGQMEAVEGTYLMTIKGIGNFDGEIVKTISVAAKPQLLKNANIKLNIKSKEFDYKDPESDNTTLADSDYTVTIADGKTKKELKKDTDFTVSYRNNDKVGTATLVLTGKGSYVGSKTITFKITGTALTTKNVEVSNISDKTYTGKAIEQYAKLVLTKADGTKVNLISGKDYTVTYQNNLKKGTATMTLKGNGNAGYTGSLKKNFKINAANMTDVTLGFKSAVVPYEKAGATVDEKVELTYNDITLVKGRDYTLKYIDNKALGKATIIMTGKGNFTGSKTGNFSIVKHEIKNTAITIKPLAYNARDGYVYKLSVTVKDGKSTLKAGVDYTVEFTSPSKADLDLWLAGDNTKAPKAVIKAPAESCYKGSVEVPVSIYNVKLSSDNTYVKIDDSANIYNGAVQLPKTVVYFSTDKAVIKELNAAEKAGTVDTVIADKLAAGKIKALNAGTDYTVSGVNNIFAGPNKGTVKISGTGMYSGSLSKKFTIQKKDIWWK